MYLKRSSKAPFFSASGVFFKDFKKMSNGIPHVLTEVETGSDHTVCETKFMVCWAWPEGIDYAPGNFSALPAAWACAQEKCSSRAPWVSLWFYCSVFQWGNNVWQLQDLKTSEK